MILRGFVTIFKQWPTVEAIADRLAISHDEAMWLYCACDVSDKTLRLVVLNDLANAIRAGVPLNAITQHSTMMLIIEPPIYERRES